MQQIPLLMQRLQNSSCVPYIILVKQNPDLSRWTDEQQHTVNLKIERVQQEELSSELEHNANAT